jgi:hypothetical protein
LPTEAFTETEMLLHWTKYAKRLIKVTKVLKSWNHTIVISFNRNCQALSYLTKSKLDFEKEMNGLLGYLRIIYIITT